MKNTNRILCTVLAVAMLLSVMLTGCSMPKIVLPGTPDVAATYGDGQTISTGEYLAYMYNHYYEAYNSLYYLESYGEDIWTSKYATIPYEDTEGKSTDLDLATYVITAAKDSVARNIVLEKMMADNNISLIEDEAKEVEESLAEAPEDAYLAMGISNENFNKAYRALYLYQRSAFFGLYGKGGNKEVPETEIRKYFDDNYLSYKIISVSLTKSETAEDGTSKTVPLTADEKAAELKKLNEYLTTCKDKGFEAAMDAYNKANASEGTEVTPSKDEDNRKNEDSKSMDETLAKVIRELKVNEPQIVEYGGEDKENPTTASLILRLDINQPETLYSDKWEEILITLKSEEFEKDVQAAVKALDIEFNEKVIKQCDPKNFAG